MRARLLLEWDKVAAKAAYDKALLIDPSNAVAQEGLRKLPSIGSAGFVFRDLLDDGGQGPDLIVLPGNRIAAGRYEVTRGEFRRYWSAGGAKGAKEVSCRDRESVFRSSKKRSWQSPDIEQDDAHPAVCISFDQAQGYVRWLSQRSGKTYRLMTSAEFDGLAREVKGGSCSSANLADQAFNKAFDSRAGASCDDGFAGTSPVGRFGAGACPVSMTSTATYANGWPSAAVAAAPGCRRRTRSAWTPVKVSARTCR